jgi:hypothetical protein
VRLIHRDRARTGSLEEGDCYEHSYGKAVLDHVDVVQLEPAEAPVETPPQKDHHVTSQGLKRQFEERFAARRRRS